MIEIQANRSPWTNDIELLVAEIVDGRMVAYGTSVMMSRNAEPGSIVEPTVRLKFTQAQALIDSLWHCGLRPSEGTGSAGALAATERHLADMQKIAFDAFAKITED